MLKIGFGQVMGLVIVLVALVGLVALYGAATPTGDGALQGAEAPGAAGFVAAVLECADPITPETVGPEEYERYGIAEKLRNGEFAMADLRDYIVCSHGPVETDGISLIVDANIYYLFHRASGDLVVTHLEGWGASRAPERHLEPTPSPTVPPPTQDVEVTTVCINADTPIIEIAGEPPEPWCVWDILSRGQCAVEMGSSICWDCGEDPVWRWVVSPPAGKDAEATTGAEGSEGMACLDVQMAAQISGQGLDEGDRRRLASGRCSLELGGDRVCWHCRDEVPEPTPSPAPTEPPRPEPRCADYLTADAIGAEAWEHYGVADMLRGGRFQRRITSDGILCSADYTIGEAVVGGDELSYWFDVESGELLRERIHWREDLPAQMHSPLISQEEAEALVEGEVDRSHLAYLNPARTPFEIGPSGFEDPCWFVWSMGTGDMDTPGLTVINAMTGEVLVPFWR